MKLLLVVLCFALAYATIDEDFADFDDGAQTCKQTYDACMAAATEVKEKALCLASRAKCHGSKLALCFGQCHQVRKECTAAASGWRAHLKCAKEVAICMASCRAKK